MTDTTDFLFFGKPQPPKYPEVSSPQSDVYKKHEKRGMAIIFNHKEYDTNLPPRPGTDKDRDDLFKTLKDLKFDVSTYDDLSSAEVANILTRVKDTDHSDYDCILVTVMSHGEPDNFYTKDKTFPIKGLWQPLLTVPSLAGKPKLFFIQACRGNKTDPGVLVGYDEADAKLNDQKLYSIPVTADILIMYSTFEGFYSYRDPLKGSYFIQSLVHQLKTAEDRNILSILTDVNREVAVNYYDKEMSTIMSTLTRRFYLD